MSVRRFSLLALAVLLSTPVPAAAAPIDDFTDPGAAPAGGGLVETNTDPFTLQGGEPFGADGSCPARDRTGWWSVTGNGLPITVATEATSFDTIIASYEATGVSLGPRLACGGDGPGNAAQVTFPTLRGRRYLVQVGGRNNSHGAVRLRFTLLRPANDDRANALSVGTGTGVSVDQRGATQEAGEVLTCGASDYAGTVWFRYTAAEALDARFSTTAAFAGVANGADTVLAVYRGSDALPLACNDDGGAAFGPSELSLRLAAGDYLVQVGARGTDSPSLGTGTVTLTVGDRDRDRDGALQPSDCDDANAAIRPGAVDVPEDGIDQDCLAGDAVNLDRDGDGFARPSDCADDRADTNPGRVDIPGDALDQDCRNGPAPFTTLGSGISGFFRIFADHTQVTELSVRRALAGAKITVTCQSRGKGCRATRMSRAVKRAKARVNLLRVVRGAKLRPGAVLRVTVRQRGFIGLVTTWRIRDGKPPRRVDRCLPPDARQPGRCRR